MIDLQETLRYAAAVQSRLAAPDLTASTIHWTDIWKAFRLFDALRDGQTAVVQAAQDLRDGGQAGHLEERVQAQLKEIVDGREGEHTRHLTLALYWRRHVCAPSSLLCC